MKLGKPDASGRKRPVPIKGSTFTMKVDTVIKAIGEASDLSLLPAEGGLTEAGARIGGVEVFGGGDAVSGAGRVVDAIASGRRAARALAKCLSGHEVEAQPTRELARFEDVNTAYFPKQAAARMPELGIRKRISDFSEVHLGISEKRGIAESARCFSCGVCRECNNCLYFCPDICVSAQNGGYEFDYDYCKGCGICSHECMAGVIRMVTEA
jgi:Pyruvate/2-oxoacid:ferredoxin oxidoreductase delta subunit